MGAHDSLTAAQAGCCPVPGHFDSWRQSWRFPQCLPAGRPAQRQAGSFSWKPATKLRIPQSFPRTGVPAPAGSPFPMLRRHPAWNKRRVAWEPGGRISGPAGPRADGQARTTIADQRPCGGDSEITARSPVKNSAQFEYFCLLMLWLSVRILFLLPALKESL
jgi:hypothetical protein